MRTRRLCALICITLASCADHPTAAPTPASIVVVSGDGQSAAVGMAVAESIVVRVDDAHGKGLPGQRVHFRLYSGGAMEPDSVVSGSGGLLQVRWTLGDTAGVQRADALLVDASGATLLTVALHATAQAGAPGALSALAGDGQYGPAGFPLPDTLAVRVLDSRGNPAPGALVQWAASSASGSVTAVAPASDGAGTARAIWTVGQVAGPQRVTATVAGVAPVSFGATVVSGSPAVVVVTPESTSVRTYEQVWVSAAVRDAFGNASGAAVTWVSKDPGIATVANPSGLVTGAYPGRAAIVASAGSALDTVIVTVLPQATVSWWNYFGSLPAETNGAADFGVRFIQTAAGVGWQLLDPAGNSTGRRAYMQPYYPGNQFPGRDWTCMGVDVWATCWSGRVSLVGLPRGTYTLVVSGQLHSGEPVSFSGTITKPLDPFYTVSVSLASAWKGYVLVGGTGVARVRVVNEANQSVQPPSVTFASSNPALATVSSSGLITGVAPGLAVISATALGVTGLDTVEVRDGIPSSLDIVGRDNLTGPVGERLYLAVAVRNAAGYGVPGVTVKWAVTGGHGTIGSGQTSYTTATYYDGKAYVSWIPGPGANTVTATVEGLTPVTFVATGT